MDSKESNIVSSVLKSHLFSDTVIANDKNFYKSWALRDLEFLPKIFTQLGGISVKKHSENYSKGKGEGKEAVAKYSIVSLKCCFVSFPTLLDFYLGNTYIGVSHYHYFRVYFFSLPLSMRCFPVKR